MTRFLVITLALGLVALSTYAISTTTTLPPDYPIDGAKITVAKACNPAVAPCDSTVKVSFDLDPLLPWRLMECSGSRCPWPPEETVELVEIPCVEPTPVALAVYWLAPAYCPGETNPHCCTTDVPDPCTCPVCSPDIDCVPGDLAEFPYADSEWKRVPITGTGLDISVTRTVASAEEAMRSYAILTEEGAIIHDTVTLNLSTAPAIPELLQCLPEGLTK